MSCSGVTLQRFFFSLRLVFELESEFCDSAVASPSFSASKSSGLLDVGEGVMTGVIGDPVVAELGVMLSSSGALYGTLESRWRDERFVERVTGMGN